MTSHTLRHSYARHLLANGIPLNVLSKWLGHSQLETADSTWSSAGPRRHYGGNPVGRVARATGDRR